MEIKVAKYDKKRWVVEMSNGGFTYHLVPTESKEEAIINKEAIESLLTTCVGKGASDELGDCNMPRVNGSYLRGIGHIHDSEMVDFAIKNNKTIIELINDMVDNGWTQGMDKDGEFEYWEG